jgi:hypothetical protein
MQPKTPNDSDMFIKSTDEKTSKPVDDIPMSEKQIKSKKQKLTRRKVTKSFLN